MTDVDLFSLDLSPAVSKFYKDVYEGHKITDLDISYFDLVVNKNGETTTRCPLLKAVWSILTSNFEIYYATREIGGETELDFFNLLQSCLNRNADTYETQLEFYFQEVNRPVIGRTEKITYDIKDERDQTIDSTTNYGREVTDEQSGNDITHHIEVPLNPPSEYDVDRTRDKIDYGKQVSTTEGGEDTNNTILDDEQKRTGTQITELSSLGIKANVEYMNEYLETNKTFIQYFIESFEECFAPRYKRVYFEF